MVINKNKNKVKDIAVTGEPDTLYNLAIFDVQQQQISNVITIQTPIEDYEPDENYKPTPPTDIEQYYDDKKENILILWDYPKSTFGESIIYRINLSNQSEPQLITELPYKLPITQQHLP